MPTTQQRIILGSASRSADYYQHSREHPLEGVFIALSLRARRKIYRIFEDYFRPTPDSKVLEVGVTGDVKRPESNFFLQWYPYPAKVVATGIEGLENLRQLPRRPILVQANALALPFRDASFDFGFSNATIEHVGTVASQRAFVRELLRVCRRCLIATPDRRFLIEPHTFLPLVHYLPRKTHRAISKALGLGFYGDERNLRLLTPSELRGLFDPSLRVRLLHVKTWGIPSNIVALAESG